MKASLEQEKIAEIDKVKELVHSLIKAEAVSVERVGGGLNSKSYRVGDAAGNQFLTKFYFAHERDRRDRLGTEFSSLQFLRRNGLTCVPRPLAMSRTHTCAVYEYIEGDEVDPEKVTPTDVEAFINFFQDLNQLKSAALNCNFQPASEACFSVDALMRNVTLRLNRLLEVKDPELFKFLEGDFKPFLQTLIDWTKKKSEENGMSLTQEIQFEQKILSPSDIGFHNVLRWRNGQMVFIDFEYFGWDDPAKTICDFLLHPHQAMQISAPLKKQFVDGMFSLFNGDRTLTQRTRIVYAFYGLKWCAIFLNEFIPHDLERRGFAQGNNPSVRDVQNRQLQKSKDMLGMLKENYQNPPWLGRGNQ